MKKILVALALASLVAFASPALAADSSHIVSSYPNDMTWWPTGGAAIRGGKGAAGIDQSAGQRRTSLQEMIVDDSSSAERPEER